MFLLPEKHGVYHFTRPVPHAVQMPAPRVRGKRFISPCFLPKDAGDKDVAKLIKGYRQLVQVMP